MDMCLCENEEYIVIPGVRQIQMSKACVAMYSFGLSLHYDFQFTLFPPNGKTT